MELTIKSALPDNSISHFVHSFWFVENNTGKDIPSTVLPNGMVDMILMKMNSENWEMMLRGIDTMPSQVTIIAGTKMFSIGFKLLAVEYLFGKSIRKRSFQPGSLVGMNVTNNYSAQHLLLLDYKREQYR